MKTILMTASRPADQLISQTLLRERKRERYNVFDFYYDNANSTVTIQFTTWPCPERNGK